MSDEDRRIILDLRNALRLSQAEADGLGSMLLDVQQDSIRARRMAAKWKRLAMRLRDRERKRTRLNWESLRGLRSCPYERAHFGWLTSSRLPGRYRDLAEMHHVLVLGNRYTTWYRR